MDYLIPDIIFAIGQVVIATLFNIPSPFLPTFSKKYLVCRALSRQWHTFDLVYCSKHNIASDIELIPIQKVNEAYPRVVNSDVRYRFVIDTKSLD